MLNLFKTKQADAFTRIAGETGTITIDDLKIALSINNTFLATRVLRVIDRNNKGFIDRESFTEFAESAKTDDPIWRANFITSLCDIDNDGCVHRDDLKQAIFACIEDQNLHISSYQVDSLINCIYKDADLQKSQCLKGGDFLKLLNSVDGLESQLDQFISDLLGIEYHKKPTNNVNYFSYLIKCFNNNLKDNLWFVGYLLVNLGLFIGAMIEYKSQGASLAVQIARGGGACLNLNCALIFFPMCKLVLGSCRHTAFGKYLPLDNLNGIHKGIGVSIVLFTIIHVAAHTVNYLQTNQSIPEALFTTLVGLTGVIATLAFVLMGFYGVIRRRNYERFLNVHKLYVPFIICILLHGPVFWAWLTPILAMYMTERLQRWVRKTRTVEVTEMTASTERVTKIGFDRDNLTNFYPGDYIKINLPFIAKDQWHPFTLSAAPESEKLHLHIRGNGNWTSTLNRIANTEKNNTNSITAHIDGPFSTPTSSIYRSRVAVLIAGGIGATPFASTLESILLNEQYHPDDQDQKPIIHFHWLNRTQKAYEWFIDLLMQAGKQLGDERFRLNIHLTSLIHSVPNIVMQIAFEVFWKRLKFDPITGLHARTSAGHPDWDKVFKDIAEEYPNEQVDVYFCGPKGLGMMVKKHALNHGLHYREEKFD